MNHSPNRYLYRTDRAFRPLIGLAAVAATVATLSLAVVTPASLPHTDPNRLALPAASQHVPSASEVAILPSIQVVGKRARVARAASPFVPAAYRPRG